MNRILIKQQLEREGIKATTAQIVDVARDFGYSESTSTYSTEHGEKILDLLRGKSSTGSSGSSRPDQAAPNSLETALATRKTDAIALGHKLAKEDLQNLLISELNLIRQAKEEGIAIGLPLVEEEIRKRHVPLAVPAASKEELTPKPEYFADILGIRVA